MRKLESYIPKGPLEDKWTNHKSKIKLVSPSNKKKITIIVVGTGLAGASAASSLADLGYKVKCFCIQDTPRRAHSIAAQGGINAAKNYQNDGDTIYRLFYDTIKGGDYRSREANVYRLSELSLNIIDQCTAQGVPFTREYSGLLSNRSFGGAQVSRTFYARGQTGQQLLIGAYSGMMRHVNNKNVEIYTRREMLDLVIVDGKARGIVCRNLISGDIEPYSGEAVVLATGGYGNAYNLSTNGKNSNVTASWRCYKRGAYFANPCFNQIHPTCIPSADEYQSKLTLMSESLRNDGRVWVPSDKADKRKPTEIKENERDYFLERLYPSFGNLVPRDVGSRAIKKICDSGYGVNETGRAVYLDFKDSISLQGVDYISDKYGNLFEMYEKITGDNPYNTAMKIYPAIHYTMGGLWVDYNLMSTIPGLFVLGEANFSDHGANRLGASALMQGLADGYFIAPYSIGNYIAGNELISVNTNRPEFVEIINSVKEKLEKILSIKGNRTALEFHRELGKILWDHVGMSRNENGLNYALDEIPKLRESFWNDLKIQGDSKTWNKNLEISCRVADFIELAELITHDAKERKESCGAHFREEYQTDKGEPLRDDGNFCNVFAWQYDENSIKPLLNKEELNFDSVELSQRDYK